MRRQRDTRHSRGLSKVFDRNRQTPTQNFDGRINRSPDGAASGSGSVYRPGTRGLRAQAPFSHFLSEMETGRIVPQKRMAPFDLDEFERKAEEVSRFLLRNQFEFQTGHVLPRVATEPPPQASIEEIFMFLRHLIDPLATDETSFRKDFLQCLRVLQYPAVSSIRGHNLINAGQPHVWPMVVDGLHYMMCVATEMNKLVLGSQIVNDRMGLDALQERQIVKAYQSELNPTEAETMELHQEGIDLALDRYCAVASTTLRKLSDEKRALQKELADLETQQAEINTLSANERRLSDLKAEQEAELSRLSAELSALKAKDATLKEREHELELRHEEIEASKNDLVAFFEGPNSLPRSYSKEEVSNFVDKYRIAWRTHTEEVIELKTLTSKKLAIYYRLRETFDKLKDPVDVFNQFSPEEFKIDITEVLSTDLGKTARTLWGRSIMQIEQELDHTTISSREQVEKLRSKITQQSRLETEKAPLLIELKAEVATLRAELEATEHSNSSTQSCLQKDGDSLAELEANVTAQNIAALQAAHEKEQALQQSLENTRFQLLERTKDLDSVITPIQDRLTATYDIFSAAYNKLGSSLNGMLRASTQIVSTMEADGKLSVFGLPKEFESQDGIADAMFESYCQGLSHQAAM